MNTAIRDYKQEATTHIVNFIVLPLDFPGIPDSQSVPVSWPHIKPVAMSRFLSFPIITCYLCRGWKISSLQFHCSFPQVCNTKGYTLQPKHYPTSGNVNIIEIFSFTLNSYWLIWARRFRTSSNKHYGLNSSTSFKTQDRQRNIFKRILVCLRPSDFLLFG